MGKTQKLNQIAHYIKQSNNKTCFIIGAGASYTAGIPLASELVEKVNKEQAPCLYNLTEDERKNYGAVMSALSPQEREELFKPLIENSKINWGQIALAALIEKKYISRVLTFNFDLVLERAVSLLGMQLPIYDFAESPTSKINNIVSPSIIHLHGQSYGFVLLNSKEETKEHAKKIEPILKDTICNHVTIVAGYSGEADAAFDLMEEKYDSKHRLIWLGYDDNQPQHLDALFEQKYAEYVGGCDFDTTMIDLASQLGVWPPKLLNNPMDHLLEELEEVTDFPVKNQNTTSVDTLTHTRERLTKHSNQWINDNKTDLSSQAIDMFVTGYFDKELADKLLNNKDQLSTDAINALYWTFISRANSLWRQQNQDKSSKINQDFKKAYKHYANAVLVDHEKYEAYYNWGVALREEASKIPDDEAIRNYKLAQVKYKKVIDIKPNNHDAYNNWGNALNNEAKLLPADKAINNYKFAYEKYQRAIDIRPNYHQAYYNWASTLIKESKLLNSEQADVNIQKAEEMALKAKEISSKGNYNLACAYALLDKKAEALKELEACFEDDTLPNLIILTGDADIDSLRDKERFKTLLEKVKQIEAG